MLSLMLAASVTPPDPQRWLDASRLQPFSRETNYLSRDGFVRWRYYQRSGIWISREEDGWLRGNQGANVGPAPAGGE